MTASRQGLSGDLYGGLTAAVVALPLGLAFGVAAFAPLGPEHAATGAVVGLMGCVLAGFFAALLGGTPTQVTGPTGPMTVVVTAFIAQVVASHGSDLSLTLALLAVMVVFGGLTEIIIGVAGGGRLVKFIPYPVVAGFMNGIAVIIALGQIKPALGITGDYAAFDWSQGTPALGVCLLTIIGTVVARFRKGLPASLVGLAVGIVAYQAFASAGLAPAHVDANTLLIGTIPTPFTSLDDLQRMLPALHLPQLLGLPAAALTNAALSGLVLGLLGAIDSLLTSIVADARTRTRHDSRRELIGQGIANIASGLGGGLPGAGATVRTLVNIDAGGKTRRSGMIHALVILFIIAAAGPLAAWIPLAALAGVLMVTAVGMVDKYSLQLVMQRHVRYEIGVMLVVTAVTVLVDLITAVGVGCIIAALLYIRQQAFQPVVHKVLRGDQIQSRVMRTRAQRERLLEAGGRTLIYRLRGSLFFGTTDRFAQELEKRQADADRFVLDFTRVQDIDLSGVQVLLASLNALKDSGHAIQLCGLRELESGTGFSVYSLLREMGVFAQVGDDAVWQSLDMALAAVEDELLGIDEAQPLALAGFDAFAELDVQELRWFESRLQTRTFAAGATVFRQGEIVDALLLVRRGRLDLYGRHEGMENRLSALTSGGVVGMRALLRVEDSAISGALRAAVTTDVFLLTRTVLDELAAQRPDLLAHLQRGLLHSAVEQIDFLNYEVMQLER
ncbi:MAG: SLC26A/SulP transporter family protein [Pseudomonadales bacterium]|nr:SLC26A/SulP transporter family protein [Pseudomonadales bacterium]MCP5182767.1 SLC26A/SulP transporter family protein [Pseudomonadales bacterium]